MEWFESPCPNLSAHTPHRTADAESWCLGRHYSERGKRPASNRPHDVYVYQKGRLWGWRCLSCGDALDPTWRRRKEAEDTARDHIDEDVTPRSWNAGVGTQETLRRAAALMRDRANGQREPHHPYSDERIPAVTTIAGWSELVDGYLGGDMGVFCASWHPAVALAVANWLDEAAGVVAWSERPGAGPIRQDWAALIVARAYLGESE